MLVSELPPWMLRLFAFVFGAIWGSFFNVAIYRWPRDMSVVTPPSQCPACGARVRAHHNIPLVGYVLLRGRAACCGAKLSPRYFVVELLSALLCVALAERLIVDAPQTELAGATLETLLYFWFVGGLLIATFSDLETRLIPDEVTLPGAALGLASSTLRAHPGVESAAIGAGGAYLVTQLVFVWSYQRLTGRKGMGEGDPLLLMMIGAFLGWQGAAFALFAGATQGSIVAILLLALGKRTAPDLLPDKEASAERPSEDDETNDQGSVDENDEEPPPKYIGHAKIVLGPFLALGALEFLFFGDQLIDWYFSLMQT